MVRGSGAQWSMIPAEQRAHAARAGAIAHAGATAQTGAIAQARAIARAIAQAQAIARAISHAGAIAIGQAQAGAQAGAIARAGAIAQTGATARARATARAQVSTGATAIAQAQAIARARAIARTNASTSTRARATANASTSGPRPTFNSAGNSPRHGWMRSLGSRRLSSGGIDVISAPWPRRMTSTIYIHAGMHAARRPSSGCCRFAGGSSTADSAGVFPVGCRRRYAPGGSRGAGVSTGGF